MREHFRGVVYPKGEKKPGRYQYMVAGIIITDEPINVGHLHSDGYIDGETFGRILPVLAGLKAYAPPYRLGDAVQALHAMADCDPSVDKRIEHSVFPVGKGKPPVE